MDRGTRRMRRLSAVAVLALVASTTAGCELLFGPMTGGSATPAVTRVPPPTAAIDSPTPGAVLAATGVVLSVVGTSPTEVTGFTLRTDDGRTLSFNIGLLDLQGGFNAGHLREHQASAERVRVVYVIDGDRWLAVQLTDAP